MLEKVWEKRTLLHCWWECKLVQSLWRTVLGFPKKLKIESPYDPTIPPLSTHLEKTKIWKERCTPIFIAALFTTVKIWMQPTCSLADEQIEKMWYIYTMEHYPATKKNEIMPFAATWMGLVSEVSQTKTNIIWYHSHRKLVLKIIKMNLFAKQKQTSRFWKQMYGYQRGNVCGGNKLEAWGSYTHSAAATPAESLQSCLTLCDPIDGSPPGFPVPGILQARYTLYYR